MPEQSGSLFNNVQEVFKNGDVDLRLFCSTLPFNISTEDNVSNVLDGSELLSHIGNIEEINGNRYDSRW